MYVSSLNNLRHVHIKWRRVRRRSLDVWFSCFLLFILILPRTLSLVGKKGPPFLLLLLSFTRMLVLLVDVVVVVRNKPFPDRQIEKAVAAFDRPGKRRPFSLIEHFTRGRPKRKTEHENYRKVFCVLLMNLWGKHTPYLGGPLTCGLIFIRGK